MEGVGLDWGDSETCENGRGQFRGMIIGLGVSARLCVGIREGTGV